MSVLLRHKTTMDGNQGGESVHRASGVPAAAYNLMEGAMRVCKCGCGVEVQGKAEYTTACRQKRRLAQLKEHHRKAKEQMISDLAAVQAAKSKPKPRPEPKRILTDAEQRRHDIELDQRLAQRCGYGNSPVKRLAKDEIARLAGQYQPPERGESVGYFDRFFGGETGAVFN